MKHAIFIALIIASVNAIAQQPPGAVTKQPAEIPKAESPGAEVKMVPHVVPVVPPPPLAASPPAAPQPDGEELTNLLRAQTNAIRALSSKLDSLEERIDKIERRDH